MKKETRTSYYPSGNKMFEDTYINDKIHGLGIWWHSNGGKWDEATYKNNIEHGTRIVFNY